VSTNIQSKRFHRRHPVSSLRHPAVRSIAVRVLLGILPTRSIGAIHERIVRYASLRRHPADLFAIFPNRQAMFLTDAA
jgi:hypothetical protein